MSGERVLELLACPGGVVIDVDVDALADPERTGRATLRLERAPDRLDLLGELRRRLRAGAHEPVTLADRTPHRRRHAATEPDRRIRPLNRLGPHRCAIELPP